MKSKILSIAISTLFAFANAKMHIFNVVSLSGDEYTLGVKYNGQVVPLTVSTFPLFTGIINVDKIDKYKYVVLGAGNAVIEEEKIERTYSDENSDVNEVYNRTTNNSIEIPELPRGLEDKYKMGSEKFQPFPKNEIYSIYAKCDEEAYASRKNEPFFLANNTRNDEPVNCTISLITPFEAHQTTGQIHLSGFGSRQYKKLSWVFKFDQKIMGRKSVKVRGVANDATLMRDKLTADIFRAMGVPVQEGTYTRLTINNDSWGLYTIVDTLSKKWYSSYIYGDNKAHVGTSYKLVSSFPTGPFANLRYIDDNYQSYNSAILVDELDNTDPEYNPSVLGSEFKRAINFIKLYDGWVKKYQNDGSENAVKALNEFLDVDSLLRLLAVESLTLPLDNFMFVQSNTELYYNPETNKYMFIPYDFDASLKGRSDFLSLTEISNNCLNWANVNGTGSDHYFTDTLLANKAVKDQYDMTLAAATRRVFNLDSLSPYIDSIAKLIREDVEWNFELAKTYNSTYAGKVNLFTMENFDAAVNNGKVLFQENVVVDDVEYGLKNFIQIRNGDCGTYTKDIKIPELALKSTTSDSISTISRNFALLILFTLVYLFF